MPTPNSSETFVLQRSTVPSSANEYIYIITHTKLICDSTSKWNHKLVLKPNKFYLFNERPVQQPNKSQELLMAAIGKTTVWEILSFIVLFSGKFLSVIINYIKMRDRLQRKSGLC